MTESEVVQIMHQLAEQYGYRECAADEFTTNMFATSNNITYNQADSAIRHAIIDGSVESVGKRKEVNGRIAKAYRHVCKK